MNYTVNINTTVVSSGFAVGELFTAVVGDPGEDLFMCRLRRINGEILFEQMIRARSSQEALEEFIGMVRDQTTGPYPGPVYGDLDVSVRKL